MGMPGCTQYVSIEATYFNRTQRLVRKRIRLAEVVANEMQHLIGRTVASGHGNRCRARLPMRTTHLSLRACASSRHHDDGIANSSHTSSHDAGVTTSIAANRKR